MLDNLPTELLVDVLKSCDQSSAWKLSQCSQRYKYLFLEHVYKLRLKRAAMTIKNNFGEIQIGNVVITTGAVMLRKLRGRGLGGRIHKISGSRFTSYSLLGIMRENYSNEGAPSFHVHIRERQPRKLLSTIVTALEFEFDFENLSMCQCKVEQWTLPWLEKVLKFEHVRLQKVDIVLDRPSTNRFCRALQCSTLDLDNLSFLQSDGYGILSEYIVHHGTYVRRFKYKFDSNHSVEIGEFFIVQRHLPLPEVILISSIFVHILADEVIRAIQEWLEGEREIRSWCFLTEVARVEKFLVTCAHHLDLTRGKLLACDVDPKTYRNVNNKIMVISTNRRCGMLFLNTVLDLND